MRTAAVAVALAISGCTTAPTKQSMVQLESQCAAFVQLDQVAGCTRDALDDTYGTGWRSLPQATEFVDFVASTEKKVETNTMTVQRGQEAIASFAASQSGQMQAGSQAQRAVVTQAALAKKSK